MILHELRLPINRTYVDKKIQEKEKNHQMGIITRIHSNCEGLESKQIEKNELQIRHAYLDNLFIANFLNNTEFIILRLF